MCARLAQGSHEVSVETCRTCPAAEVGCTHLRFTLRKVSSSPIVVRYGTGRVEVWGEEKSRLEFVHAACAAKVTPIVNAHQCVGCSLRASLVAPEPAVSGKVVLFPPTAVVDSAASP
jgi:hypothetical protein